jgi:hypothetical protein
VVATLFHPSGADPNDAPAAFAEYAADRLWVWTHLGQFVGAGAIGAALALLSATLDGGRASAFGRLARYLAVASIALAAALQAVDGVALKATVDRWAAAAAAGRAVAFEAAFAVRQIEVGLAGLYSLVVGIAVICYGVALLLALRAAWLGALGIAAGVAIAAAGGMFSLTGFSPGAMTTSAIASLALIGWVGAVSVDAWRHARARATA